MKARELVVPLVLATAACDRSAAAPTQAPTEPGAAPSSAPETIEVTVKNECPEDVKVLFGAQSAGLEGETLAAGSEQQRAMKPGDRMFLFKKDGSVGQSAEVEGDGGQITVLETCTMLRATEKGSLDDGGPSSSDFLAGVGPVKPEARACGPKHKAKPGTTVTVRLVITGATGKVKLVEPIEDDANTPLGECVAQALAKAEFATFEKPEHELEYSLKLE